MRRRLYVALSTAVLLLTGCEGPDAFHCLEDAQCGAGGVCEAKSSCSFEDQACDSGRRYGELSPDGIANACVPIDDLAEREPDQQEASACAEESSCDACVTCALDRGPCGDVLQSCTDFDSCMQLECGDVCGAVLESTCEE